MKAKRLTGPTGRPVRSFGPTGGSRVHADPRDWENDPWQPDERSSQVERKPFVPRPRAIWDVRRREDVRPLGEGVA